MQFPCIAHQISLTVCNFIVSSRLYNVKPVQVVKINCINNNSVFQIEELIGHGTITVIEIRWDLLLQVLSESLHAHILTCYLEAIFVWQK